MENSKWQPSNIEKVGKMERCLLGPQEVQVPEIFVEQRQIFNEVFSQETWNKVLTESQRQHLMTFLPKFPEHDNEERRETLRRLFKGDNFKFCNPLQRFHLQLKDGAYSPDIAKYSAICKKVKQKEYEYKQQKYYASLVKEILLSRQRVFEQLRELPPEEPLKFEYTVPKPKDSPLEMKVKRKYKRLLQEVRRECAQDNTSSEEDEGSPVQRSKKQLFKSLNPVPSPEPVIPSVMATYAAKPELSNDDSDESPPRVKRPRPISPAEVTEDGYRRMLVIHRRRQLLLNELNEEEHPEYNTQNITLQDVLARCQASRKGASLNDDDELDFHQPPTPVVKTKIKKEKVEKRSRKKAAKKISQMDLDNETEDSHTNISIENMEDDTSTLNEFPLQSLPHPEENRVACFFSLIKTIILKTSDQRISTIKLEEKVREWQESSASEGALWVTLEDDWVDLVASALKFLAGESIGMNMDDFIPYLDYKERAQQWQWIGVGRDSDETLTRLCDHWLKHKAEFTELVIDTNQGSPPPARSRTGYVVRATTEEEKAHFQIQEKERFENPHKAFTYEMHGYESVVGPVKGVFSKKTDMTKAREHALLVPNRPAFVTILTLVRDSVARLPNGEGTRGDICELLKDSQFLAPGITDNQINVVVSGALDRLHSEKDPCVKYDVNRKVWIYLHRSRSEEEFEKIHQAQAAAVKAKKSLSKPKTPKASSQKLRDMTSGSSGGVAPTLTKTSSSEQISVDDVGPSLVTQAQLLKGSTAASGQPQVPVTRTITHVSPKTVKQQAGATKTGGVTQSLTPAQLQLLQKAAADQAALMKAQAEAQAAKAQAQQQAAQAKNLIIKDATQAGVSPSKSELTSALQKNITLGQGQIKVVTQTPITRTAVPPNVTIQTKPEILLQRQASGQSSPIVQTFSAQSLATKTAAVATTTAGGSPVTVLTSAQAAANPLVARLMQQMSGGQVVSVNNLLAAQRSLQQQQQQQQGATQQPSFKIQTGNVVQQMSAGKPLQLTSKGQLVQIGGKGQPTLGLIQTPQGTINIIPQAGGASGGVVTIAQPKQTGTGSNDASQSGSPTVTTPGQSKMVGQVINQSKVSLANMMSQLTSGNITIRPGGGAQGKMITQAGLVPTQFLLQQSPNTGKTIVSQSGGAQSILVTSSSAGAQAQNLQVVRTVLSQQAGLKPGQATILISQPSLQQGATMLPSGAQIVQQGKAQGKTTQAGKQPMYARIITPPANMNVRLAGSVQGLTGAPGTMLQAVGQSGQTINVQADSALRQTLNKIITVTGVPTQNTVVMTTVPSSPIATSQQILAAAAQQKRDAAEQDKKVNK